MSIRLSDKHGVNPCIPLCIFCSGEKNEIVLLGRMPNDTEAPRNAVIDYEPCDNCRANMETGITILESNDGRTPTGAYVVITEDATKRLFSPASLVNSILHHRKAFMDSEAFSKLFRKFK